MEEAEHLRYDYEMKLIKAKRKETVECVFADAKEKDSMWWTKNVHAGDAYFCCIEFKEVCHMDMAILLIGEEGA